jgi:tetratricopeptide (TPR) repeat protein
MSGRAVLARSLFCIICITGYTALHPWTSLGFPAPTGVAADGTTADSPLYDPRQILELVASLVPTIDDPELRDETLKSLAQVQRTAGDLQGSRNKALLIADAYVKADSLEELAVTHVKRNEVQEALDIAGLIQEGPRRAGAVGAIAAMLVQTGQHENALQFTIHLTDSNTRASARRLLIDALELTKNPASARQLLASIPETWHMQGLNSVAEVQAALGESMEARKTATSIRDINKRMLTIIGITAIQARRNEFREARTTADALLKPLDMFELQTLDRILSHIAENQAQAGDFAAARQTASTIDSMFYRSHAWYKIARAYAQAGRFRDARATILHDIQTDIVSSEYGFVQFDLAEMRARTGDVTGALQEMAGIQGEQAEKAKIYRVIGQYKGAHGTLADAVGWTGRLKSPLFKAHALLGVYEGSTKRKEP